MHVLLRFAAAGCVLTGTAAMAQPYGYLTPSVSSSAPSAPDTSTDPRPVDPRLFEQMFDSEQTAEAAPLVVEEDFVPENLRGRVERGVLPDFLSRSQNRSTPSGGPGNGRGANRAFPGSRSFGNLPGRSTGGNRRSSSRTSTQRSGSDVANFTNNAFLFDSNGDGQLAAHELSNMFLVLTSDLDAEDNGASRGSVNGVSQESVNQNLLRRQSVREAESVFLKLTLDFDRNADGLLNRGEVGNLAGCLQQNNLSLLDASQQATQPQTGTTRAIPNAIAPTNPTPQSAPQTAAPAQSAPQTPPPIPQNQ